MRPKLVCIVLSMVVALGACQPASVAAAGPPAQATWTTYINSAYGWAIRYPGDWRINQGDLGPLPWPLTTKFSTYAAKAGEKVVLTAEDAEVWITVTDAAEAAAAGADFSRAGYTVGKATVAGLPATRYTAGQPTFGVYDAVIVVIQERAYRIYLSASTHAFDDLFQSMLETINITNAYHSDAGFSVRYPVTWRLLGGNGDVGFEPADAAGQVRFGVSHADSPAASADAVIAAALDQLVSEGTIENLDKFPSTASVGDRPAAKLSYRYVRKADKAEIKGIDIGVKAGDTVFMLRYAAAPAVYDRWLSAFDQFANSFSVHAVASIAEVLAQPLAYQGNVVTLSGDFLGWGAPATQTPATAAPPVTRSDWLVQDKGQAIYVQAGTPLSEDSLSPDLTGGRDAGKRLRITGVVRLTDKSQPYIEPLRVYPDLAGAWVRRDAGNSAGLALELTQVNAALRGRIRLTSAGQAGPLTERPIAGNVLEGDKLFLKTTDNGPTLEIDARLSADGRAFDGTLKSGTEAPEKLHMVLGELALPGTGADLAARRDATVRDLGIVALLLGVLGLWLAKTLRERIV